MTSSSSPAMQRDRRPVFVLLAGVLLAIFASAAWAAAAPDPAGRIIRTLGVVEAVAADGSVRRLRRGEAVFEGDTLRTGARGRAQIRFTDRGLMSLRPETELSIDDYEYDARAPSTARQELRLSRGGFRAATGRVADGNRAGYRVSTPLAVIGVRGTLWSARQALNGPLALGVENGGIEATSTSGRTARLGLGAGFDFARINVDGSVELLVEPPTELAAGAGIEEGDGEEGGDGGDGEGDDGGDFGGGEEAGQADAPAETGGASASTGLAATTNNPENTGAISQSESGSGNVATEQPVLGAVLLPDDRAAIIASTDVVIVAGTGSDAVDGNGEPIFDTGIGVAVGIGALDAAGEPLLASAVNQDGLGEVFRTSTRQQLLDQADAFLTGDSAAPGQIFEGQRTFLPAGGDAGVVWGSFAQPTRIFLDPVNRSVFADTNGDNDLLFALGTPSDIADLTGTATFTTVDSRIVSTGGFVVTGQAADAVVDFGIGSVDGIIDVFLSAQADPQTQLFSYIVDFNGFFQDGLLSDLTITSGELLDNQNATVLPVDGDITGFFSGSGAEFLNLAFAYQTPGRTDLNVQGLVLLQQEAAAPLQPLTAGERTLLEAGFGFAAASCCPGGPFASRITDPRASAGQDALLVFNGAVSTSDPAFNEIPANNMIIRPDEAIAQFFGTVDVGGGADVSFYELQGFSDGPGLAGGPFGFYAADTGSQLSQSTQELLVIAGRIADVADLTGKARYELFELPQGFFSSLDGGFGSFVEPGLQANADVSFNVDFATAEISGGILRLFTDLEDAGLPADARDRIDAAFSGLVALDNGNPFVDFSLNEGFVIDSDGDAGGSGVFDPSQSSLAGFFAGDGSVFNMAFSLISTDDPQSPEGTISPTAFVGNAVLTRQDLAPTAAELAEFDLGFVFVGAECCGPASSTGVGLAGDLTRFGATAGATDVEVIFGINTDPAGDDLGALAPGVLENSTEEILRPLNSTVFADPEFPVDPGAGLVAVAWIAESESSGVLVDTQSGNITDPLGEVTFFMGARPTPVATLTDEGFLTFSGNSIDEFTDMQGDSFATLGGFFGTNIDNAGVLPAGVLDPDDVFVNQFINAPEADVSFNVDFSDSSFGSVTNGSIYAAVIGNSADGSEVGLQLFFDGSIDLGPDGNPLVEASILGGNLAGIPLNMEETDVELFFIGDGFEADGSLTAIGSYSGVTMATAEFPEPIVVTGTFSIGQGIVDESRLNTLVDQSVMAGGIIDDATAFNAGRLGIATFGDFSLFGGSEAPAGSNGFLLGRLGRQAAASGLIADEIITIGANAWEEPGRDPVTGAELGEVRTERRDFYSQPFDFVLRRGSNPTQDFDRATQLLFDDVQPDGGSAPSFAADGFDVSWGVWQSSGSTDSAVIQEATETGVSTTVLDRELFFASVNPTPTSQLPVVGQFTYTSLSAVGFGTDYIGSGTGPFMMVSGSELGVDYVTASFDLDFATGDVTGGVLETGYSLGIEETNWVANFDGFTNAAVLDLQVSSLEATYSVDGAIANSALGDLGRSEIGGILTGPSAERAVLGFNFAAEVNPGTPGDFETVSGIAILDRQASGTMRPSIPFTPPVTP